MAEKKKSIIEEALLDYTKFQEAIKANSKEILHSIMKEEIEGVIKEAAEEADYDEEDVDDAEEKDETPEMEVDADSEGEEDKTGEEPEMGIGMSDDASGQDAEEIEAEPEVDGLDLDGDMDLTSKPDEEVIQVFKKLSGNDEIEVVSDNEVTIKDPQSGAEYHVKLKGAKPEGSAVGMDVDAEPEFGAEPEADAAPEAESEGSPFESESEDDDMVYEITLDDEDENEMNEGMTVTPVTGIVTKSSTFKEVPKSVGEDKDTSGDNLEGGFDDKKKQAPEAKKHVKGSVTETESEVKADDEEKEEELEEVSRTIGLGDETKGGLPKMRGSKPEAMKESVEAKYNRLLAEAKRLKAENVEFKKQNGEFREALLEVKSKFAETQVFSANLAYVAKLFMEHTTSKSEKQAIIKRFDDGVVTIKESQKLYKTIKTELEGKPTISESVDSKINKTVDSSSTAKLNESTVYVDASTKRIIDLMKRVENPIR